MCLLTYNMRGNATYGMISSPLHGLPLSHVLDCQLQRDDNALCTDVMSQVAFWDIICWRQDEHNATSMPLNAYLQLDPAI